MIHVLGWVAGTWIPMICLVLHRLRVRALSGRPDFSTTSFSNGPVVGAAVAGWLAGLGHGYYLATWWVSG
ncbi:hypothetical protein [Actinosynnema sp. ALI-1.44]|uniref:hypothetical protein n=1 Tax=Actinosynnema sp. ALI-1.44 TaxID=1933779 RepID=UPI00117741FB|nr:hypothetical protein [Actinosynnema sp. ALI-1.44]